MSISGDAARRSGMRSRPESEARRMSRNATSNTSREAHSRAAWAVAAGTTLQPSCSRQRPSVVRMFFSSSTTRTFRVGMGGHILPRPTSRLASPFPGDFQMENVLPGGQDGEMGAHMSRWAPPTTKPRPRRVRYSASEEGDHSPLRNSPRLSLRPRVLSRDTGSSVLASSRRRTRAPASGAAWTSSTKSRFTSTER